MHEPAAVPAYVPAVQGVHSSAPSAEYVPAEHVSQSQCVAAYSPAAHVTLSSKGLQPLRGTDTVSGEARGRGKLILHTLIRTTSRLGVVDPAPPRHLSPAARRRRRRARPGCPRAPRPRRRRRPPPARRRRGQPLFFPSLSPCSGLLPLAGPKVLARDRAPRPFYSRTTKRVNAWKVLPCCRQTAARCAAASRPRAAQALAQIPAGGGIAAPRKTAPGRPGRVPRIPREGSRAALATAAARATEPTTTTPRAT